MIECVAPEKAYIDYQSRDSSASYVQTKEMEIQVGNSLDLIDHIFLDAKLAATRIQQAWHRYKQKKQSRQPKQQ